MNTQTDNLKPESPAGFAPATGSAFVVESLAFEGPKSGPDRGYTVRASYLKEPHAGDALVEILKDGQPLRQFTFPAYTIWNIAAHFKDIVDGEIEKSANGYAMAASDGLGGYAPMQTGRTNELRHSRPKTRNDNMQTELPKTETLAAVASSWKTILAAGRKAAAAYAELVAASDALAAVMPYNSEYVLRRVMHQKDYDRRNSKRIIEWLNADREKIEADLKSWNEEQREESERAALLEKLKLTDEQKALLGIKGKQ